MKALIWIAGLGLLSGSALAEDCVSLKRQLQELKDEIDKYQPAPPAQSSGSGQRNGMTTHSGNTGAAVSSAGACSTQYSAYSKKLGKLLDKLKENSCEEVDEAKAAKKDTDAKAAQCAAAGKEAQAQGDKSDQNKDKMGDKKDEKGGGGGGGMPQLPQMPQQKKDNSPDPAKVEAARQARITACKNAANNTLNTRKTGCESSYNYNPTYPVANVLQSQNECKQNAIFASQTDQNNCDAANPPGTSSQLPMPSDNFNPNVTTTH